MVDRVRKAVVLAEVVVGKAKAVDKALQKLKPFDGVRVDQVYSTAGPYDAAIVLEGPDPDKINRYVVGGGERFAFMRVCPRQFFSTTASNEIIPEAINWVTIIIPVSPVSGLSCRNYSVCAEGVAGVAEGLAVSALVVAFFWKRLLGSGFGSYLL